MLRMRLNAYLGHIYDGLYSRRDLSIESFNVVQFPADQTVLIEGRLRYWDGSLLRFYERVGERGLSLVKLEYAYHYQSSDSELIFRYDNAPHHAEISSHPHHKHIGDQRGERIKAAQPPSHCRLPPKRIARSFRNLLTITASRYTLYQHKCLFLVSYGETGQKVIEVSPFAGARYCGARVYVPDRLSNTTHSAVTVV